MNISWYLFLYVSVWLQGWAILATFFSWRSKSTNINCWIFLHTNRQSMFFLLKISVKRKKRVFTPPDLLQKRLKAICCLMRLLLLLSHWLISVAWLACQVRCAYQGLLIPALVCNLCLTVTVCVVWYEAKCYDTKIVALCNIGELQNPTFGHKMRYSALFTIIFLVFKK